MSALIPTPSPSICDQILFVLAQRESSRNQLSAELNINPEELEQLLISLLDSRRITKHWDEFGSFYKIEQSPEPWRLPNGQF